MVSSTVDTAPPAADQVHEKVASNGTADKAVSNGAVSNGHTDKLHSAPSKAPLKLSGVLDGFKSFEVTPVIGREYPDANLAEWLKAPNSDELLKDLAITGS